jgi:FtsH-binding integral membrane protein
MTLYGYTTCTDLSRFGSFLFMGLIDIIIASLVNIFVASDALQFAISVIGVLIFVGLTAYDTQRIKEICQPSTLPAKFPLEEEMRAAMLALGGGLTVHWRDRWGYWRWGYWRWGRCVPNWR